MQHDTRNATLNDSRGRSLERIGGAILRYGLVLELLWIGALKFTSYEPLGVHKLASTSPLLSWGYSVMSVQGFAELLGIVEITLAVFIATRAVAPKLSALGSMGVIVMALITLSFVLTTPAAWQPAYGFPFLSPNPGQFLLKDVLMLGSAVWTAGEALIAASERAPLLMTSPVSDRSSGPAPRSRIGV